MRSYNKFFILVIALVLLLSISNVSANNLENTALNHVDEDSSLVLLNDAGDMVKESSEEIIVDNWDDLQFYCSQNDKNYVLKLKENTNFYPSNLTDVSYQIQVNNNVTIVGSSGAYFGDTSPDARNIHYIAIDVPENSGYGLTLKNVTFKWISTSYMPDGLFLRMAGNANNIIENCQFYNCTLTGGHSSLVYLLRGDLTLSNCSFKNIVSDFGCLSLYDPKENPMDDCKNAHGEVVNCYFEGNFARSEPGCINNCGVLVVRNSTFYKNSAFWWAGAIHTHGGANTTIYDSNFTDNEAGWNGGALYTYSYLQIYNTIFVGNNCTTNNGGGAIGASKYMHCPYIYIEDSLFEDNENRCWGLDELSTTGTGRGGAISIMDDGGLTVLNTTFIKNSASIGTAICAIAQGSYGSPDVTIIGNRFINHTRAGDVLVIKLNYNSKCEISDNYYSENSIEFSRLKLIADERVGDEVTLHVDAALKNPKFYDSDILDKTSYDVYMDGQYLKTVNSKDFTLNLKNIEKAQVYVVPSISITKSSEVSVGVPVEYIYVSQNSGNDGNNGSKNAPVKTISKAIELANATGNIIIMDGTFSEANLNIDYNLTIAGESNVVFSSKGNVFNVGNVELSINNLTFKNCKQESSSSERIIKQSGGILKLQDCTFESNSYNTLIQSDAPLEVNNLKFSKNNGILIQAENYVIMSSVFDSNTATTKSKAPTLIKSQNGENAVISDSIFSNNNVLDGCINFYAKLIQNILTITDSTFINNVANDGCSGIQMPYSGGLLDIKSSLFVNNTDSGSNGALILTSTEVHVTDSIFIANTIENKNHALFNSKSSANLKKIYCDGNWFGNTQDDYNITPQVSSSSNCDYWLFLNASANVTSLFVGERADVSFDLNNIYNKNGNVTYWDSSKLPTVRLSLSATGGRASDSKLTLVYGMANTIYTALDSEGALTASYNGWNDVIYFTEARVKPEMNVTVNNISVDDDEIIIIELPADAQGNLTVSIGKITQTQNITNPKTTFTFSGLPADNLTAIVAYSGDDYYDSITKSVQFSVNKYNSTTALSVGQIVVGSNVTLTVNVSPNVAGNVTFIINKHEETLNLVNSAVTYTIQSIARGDYDIKAIYNGNYKYLPSQDAVRFSVDKLNTSISAKVNDIVYGHDAVMEVTLDNVNATGNVTVRVDGINKTAPVNNSKAVINISKLNAGNKTVYINYSGDNVFNPNNYTTSFNVGKANTTLKINVNDIMIGQDENVEVIVESGVDGNITIIYDGRSTVKTIPRTGKVSLKLSDLTVDKHNVSAFLTSNNYFFVENSTQFEVSDYETPQWPNEGYDIQNTGKSPYDVDSNGAILWNYTANGNISGNLAIDSEGNIYLIADDGVYSISSNGTYLWKYATSGIGNLSALAISRDLIIAPEAGNSIHFINQTTGKRYGNSNIYQGSSQFAPIVDLNANIYISSEYQYRTDDYNLVVIPYGIWQKGGNPTLISLGKSAPISAPVIVNENIALIACEDSLKIIDLKNKVISSSIRGTSPGVRPIAGPGNMIYAVLDDYVVELTPQGNIVWKSKITGGAGSYMALDEEWGLYLINSLGNLCRYDLIDGEESVISNLTFTSGILMGTEGSVYVGSKDMFYAFGSEGDVLWKTAIDGDVIGIPIADNEGTIYLTTQNSVYALSVSDLKDIDLNVSVKDINYGEIEIMNITVDCDATGKITYEITSDSYKNASTIILTGSDYSIPIYSLSAGNYTVEVTYSGDLRYKSTSDVSEFRVNKYKFVINESCVDISEDENVVITVSLPSDAEGNVSIGVDGRSKNVSLDNGNASAIFDDVLPGEHVVTVCYLGDEKYEASDYAGSFNVSKWDSEIDVVVGEVVEGRDVNVTIRVLNATGDVFVIFGLSNSSLPLDENSTAVYTIEKIAAGKNILDIFYPGDDNYDSANRTVVINVTALKDMDLNVYVVDINYGETEMMNITVDEDATGKITYEITSDSYENASSIILTGNNFSIPIYNLPAGNYTVNVTYSGDSRYKSASNVSEFKVSKYEVVINESCVDISTGQNVVITVSLPADVTGDVSIGVDNRIKNASLDKGRARVIFDDVLPGEHVLTVCYLGDEKYDASNYTGNLFIDVSTKNSEFRDITVSGKGIITAVLVDSDNKAIANADITYTVNEAEFKTSTDENGRFNISSGSDAVVGIFYLGSEDVLPTNTSITLKNVAPLRTATDIIANDYETYSIDFKAGERGNYFKVQLVDVNGKPLADKPIKIGFNGVVYDRITDSDGRAQLQINLKNAGVYTFAVAYLSDDDYTGSFVVQKITVNEKPTSISAPAKSYKASAKTKSYTVTLKTIAGSSIDGKTYMEAGKKITLTVNGKTYSASTNSKGQATFKLSITKKGSYTATISFAGDNAYKAAKTTAKIKIT